ncbi:hypothetical protein [Rheinheimera texasensis]|uniref:hypothetical protein n=1 Tax=Rheinheimera texasensis TaxID=306205 RepID=UPI0004E12F39|nr:hypothetical protein [Rheinheimera texasensis]
MALFETDWTKELDQVHAVAKKIIDDDVSPMIDKKIGLLNKHADELMRKSAFQADNLAKEMVKEIELQREKLVADVTKIALILMLGFTASGAALIWLFFLLRNGFGG